MFVLDNLNSGNYMGTTLRFVLVHIFLVCINTGFSQQENWYVLQILHPANDMQIKSVMSEILVSTPNAVIWYNGAKSNTMGCKSTSAINWPQIIHNLILHDFFIAEVTNGAVHYSGINASASYFFVLATYYAGHSDEMPVNWIAQLNHDEWDALHADVRDYYTLNGNYEIVEK